MKSGKLVVDGENLYVRPDGGGRRKKVNTNQLAADLQKLWFDESSRVELDGIDVDYEDRGAPSRVRRQGKEFEAGAPAEPVQVENEARDPLPAVQGNGFVNPYNFVPAPPHIGHDTGLSCGPPAGHGRAFPERWGGTIDIRLAVKTDLLLPDESTTTYDTNGHRTSPVRKVHDRPYLAPSGVKGPLSAAYEAITNSRYRVLDTWDEPLFFRQPALVDVVPGRVVADGNGGLEVEVLPGIDPRAHGPIPQAAAWYPCHHRDPALNLPIPANLHPSGEVEVKVQLVQVRGPVRVWRVTQLLSFVDSAGATQRPVGASVGAGYVAVEQRGGPVIRTERGYLHVTGRNFPGKHDERVFFRAGGQRKALSERVKARWKNLIADYQHSAVGNPAGVASSDHVANPQDWDLKDGRTLWVRLDDTGEVCDLFPVMIGREAYECAPMDLIPGGLRPAEKLDELSAADRVWGWVGDGGSYRGQVRVGPTRLTQQPDGGAFDPQRRTLAVLSSPKPAQARFYGARSPGGARVDLGERKRDLFTTRSGLRGRKFYLHHQEPDSADQLTDSMEDQNRTVVGSIRPGTVFSCRLEIHNLNDAELGALLWLLTMPADHYLRFGYAKPLGFGSVRASIESANVARGATTAERLGSLRPEPIPPLADSEIQELKNTFRAALENLVGETSADAILGTFMAIAEGSSEVRYPLTNGQDPGAGERYKWFVSNEHLDHGHHDRAWPLPDHADGAWTLPALPDP